MITEIDKVEAAVKEHYPSIHAFCVATGLSRTVVYQVLKGNYRGNVGLQLAKIKQALTSRKQSPGNLPTVEQLESIIRSTACKRCPVVNAEICRVCAATHLLQAQAVHDYLVAIKGV